VRDIHKDSLDRMRDRHLISLISKEFGIPRTLSLEASRLAEEEYNRFYGDIPKTHKLFADECKSFLVNSIKGMSKTLKIMDNHEGFISTDKLFFRELMIEIRTLRRKIIHRKIISLDNSELTKYYENMKMKNLIIENHNVRLKDKLYTDKRKKR
jgi:hypothetical protein